MLTFERTTTPAPAAMAHTPKMMMVDQWSRHVDVTFVGGSRGSGKTTGLILTLVRIIQEQGAAARVFVGRESHAGCIQLGNELFLLLCLAFGQGNVTRNQNAGTISIRFPEGIASVEIRPFSDTKQYASIQGKTYTVAAFDEAGNYAKAGWDLMWQIMSNMRGPEGMHLPVLVLANPFGTSHGRIVKTFLNKAPWWTPYEDENGLRYINCQVNLTDNPHIDQQAYIARLKRACAGNPEKERAWIYGEFGLNVSSFFGNQWNPDVHLLPTDLIAADLLQYRPILGGSGDWGTRSACAGFIGLKLRSDLIIQDRHYSAGSIFVLGECHTLADRDMEDLSTGTGIAPQGWAEIIRDLAINQQGLKAVPPFIQDNARGLANDTVTTLMAQAGVPCHSPSKDRKGGWALITQLLDNATTGDGPGLFVHPSCLYLLATLPDAPANPNDPSDLDPKWDADHAVDALSYLCTFLTQRRGRRGRIRDDF